MRVQVLLAGIVVAGVVGCSTDAAVVNDGLVPGTYSIFGTRVMPTGAGEARAVSFTILTVAPSQIILDFITGDVGKTLPARDTALVSGAMYTVQWNGNATFNHSLQFDPTSCSGTDISGGGEVTAWVTCSIRRSN